MATAVSQRSPDVSFKDWIGIAATLLGAFMAVLDIQITNASLNEIQASLSATLEEGSWISTSYLVAEIVVIPLTGWLSGVFSIRRYLLVNASLFLFFSVACAFASSLPMMIIFRAAQGFTGGVLIPIAFTVILTTLPSAKQPIGLALFGITATFAPSIGPAIGGWLTDHYSWHYIFYLNLVPGALLIAGVWYALPGKPMQLHLLNKGDWYGIATMAIGLGSLEVVLEEGNRKDWFSSDLILRLAIVAAISLSLFLAIEFTRREPFINLRLLGQRNFGLSFFITLALGLGLYGSVFILPLFLTQIQDYNATQIGITIMWAGFPQLAITPFIPLLMKKFDLRFLTAVGLSLFAVSCFMNSNLTEYTGTQQLIPSQIVRAMGQPLVLTPLSSIATAGIAVSQVGSASALFNMARNLGGSTGIAALATLLSRREQFHSNRLGEAISLYSPLTQQRIDQLTQNFASRGSFPGQAHDQAIAAISNTVRTQSTIMAYNDCFYFMGWALMISALLVLLFKNATPRSGPPAGH
ncbi:MAG: DHA2 family efflux MFS transporter permease subunit [Phormidesmis sp.]